MPEQKLIGNWVGLPESTLDSEQWLEFTPATRAVYTTMLKRYYRKGNKATGRVKWKQEELAEEARLSLNTIKRSVKTLIEKEWISKWEPGGRWLDGTTYEVDPVYANGKE